MSRLVLLLEEPSMKALLDTLLPRLFPELLFLCVPHEGKADLEKSIPRKLRAWREPGVRFVVLRDNDGGDCSLLKQRLLDLCAQGGRDDSVVRIVCQELEAWYLGDPEALAEAFDDTSLRDVGRKARFREPDSVVHPAAVIAELAPAFQKVSGARAMAAHMAADRNASNSFRVFIEAVRGIANGAGD